MKRYLILIFFLLSPQVALSAQTGDLELQARSIAAELRCVVCQNLSVADSPSEMAQQMRGIIREQLQAGKTREEIKAYFVSKYGEWVLLSPSPKGFSLLVWVLPFVAVIAGILFVVFVVRRWAQKNNRAQPPKVDPALIERVQRDVATAGASDFELEEGDVPSPLLQERTRLYANLKELEFDFQAVFDIRRIMRVLIVSIISTVVVLPAPFGPRKANTSPFLTVNDMALTARKSP